jgi:hypothetical protein
MYPSGRQLVLPQPLTDDAEIGWILYHAQPPVSKATKEMKHNVLFTFKQCLRMNFVNISEKYTILL